MNLIVFAGTSEGRQLYEFCAGHGIEAVFCVATDYGREVLPAGNDKLCKLKIRVGRMERGDMEEFFRREKPCLIIDATHPYAARATENIRAAARRYARSAGIDGEVYCRVRRETEAVREETGAEYFADMAQAAARLDETEGRILVTTGSREMDVLCKLKNYAERVYVRILPNPEILRAFLDRGFLPDHMICMQGPFTEETNLALLRQFGIRCLLTKRSGAAGGYAEKCRAAQAAGVSLFVVLPPGEDAAGCSVEEAQERILRCLRERT